MIKLLAIVGIIIMNMSMIPQISRIIKLKNSHAISLMNVWTTLIALIIFYGLAVVDKNAAFIWNYLIGITLQIILVGATIIYREKR